MKCFTKEAIENWVQELLMGTSMSLSNAKTAADIFLRAQSRGVGHHDLSFLPQRLTWLTKAGVKANPSLTLVQAGPSFEVWDGDEGLGELCCTHIVNRAMEIASNQGIGFANIKRSNHFLAAAPYAEIAVEKGYFLMVFSNTDPCMAAPNGSKNIIGNDPMGFGMQRNAASPLILDICMAYSSLGNLRAYAEADKSIPAYWGKDANGNASSKAKDLLNGGSVAPMASHKGFGLALMTEVLTGILSGGATGNTVKAGGGINTHNQAAIAFSLKHFGGSDVIASRVDELCDRLKADQTDLRLPGERAGEAQAKVLNHGWPISDALYTELCEWSKRFSVVVPNPLSEV